MLIPFLALMRKDLKLFFADRRAVLMSVVAPIAIASFFGYIFGGGAGNTDDRISILVADQDGTNFSREIVNRLQSDASLDVKLAPADAARDAVRKGKSPAALIIPKNFGAAMAVSFLSGGAKPDLDLPYDPSHSLEMRMLQGVAAGAVMEAAGKQLFPGTGSRGPVTLPFRVNAEALTSQKTRRITATRTRLAAWESSFC